MYSVIWCEYWDYAAGEFGGWGHDLGTFASLEEAADAYSGAAVTATLLGLPAGERVLTDHDGDPVVSPGNDYAGAEGVAQD